MKRLFLTPALVLLAACGTAEPESFDASRTACSAGVAQIAVSDGHLQRLCGCDEPSVIVGSGTSLTCSVPAGTSVAFLFQGVSLRHQIVSAGEPAFPASGLFNPQNGPNSPKAHIVTLTAAGTYLFSDVYDPALRGQITVY